MKKTYQDPNVLIVWFEKDDVISTSVPDNVQSDGFIFR